MNCSNLREKAFVDLIKNITKDIYEINHEANHHVMWDVIKTSVKEESIKYGTEKEKNL